MIDWGMIGAGLPLVMDFLGQREQRARHQDAISSQEYMAQKNIEMQREFAQNGVSWRAADAEKAGIHPLYAMGAQTHSFSPVSVNSPIDDSMSDFYSKTGQNITRAITSTQTEDQRQLSKLQLASMQTQIDGQMIENQIKASQLQKMNSTGPAMAGSENFIPGQGNSPIIRTKPSERTHSATGRPSQQAGWVPDVGYARTDSGLTPVPSQDVKERIEDQIIPETMWAMRNYLVPNFTGKGSPPRHMLPKGSDNWKWSHIKQEWQPAKTRLNSRRPTPTSKDYRKFQPRR